MKKLSLPFLLVFSSALLMAGPAPAADVNENWTKNCALCHAKDGSGNTIQGKKNKVRDYRDPKFHAEFSDAKMADTIKNGVHVGSKERMEAFGDKFTPEEITALVAYVRKFKK